MATNRQYKSSVFSVLLEDKRRAMELYNALNNTQFTDESGVEIKRLDTGVLLSIHNDASFIFDSSLSVYEHQSTPCPNMPLRGLFYIAGLLHDEVRDKNLYGSAKVKIPNPKFVVFYNGVSSCPEVQEMKLSGLFIKEEEKPTLELKCMVYNINESFNKELLARCKWLSDYMTFVNRVNEYHKGRDNEDLTEDIEKAVDYCIANDILKEFFLDNRSEIIKMTVLDYTFERQIELEKKASFEQGEEQGAENKIIDLIKKKLARNKSPEEIAEDLEENVETITGLIEKNKLCS